MNIKLFSVGLALVGLTLPGSVSANELSSAMSQSTQNEQNNSGSVVLNPSGGTQVNNNVNNAYSSTYTFGVGYSCPTPSLAFNGYGGGGDASGGGNNSSSMSYGGSVSFIMPLGGRIVDDCKEQVLEIVKQRKLDTQVNMVKVCANFAKQGIIIDTEAMPEFAICSAITLKD